MGRIYEIRDPIQKHHRAVFETPEIPSPEDRKITKEIKETLGNDIGFIDYASNSWYKLDSMDVSLVLRPGHKDEKLTKLSTCSSVVSGLKTVERTRIYVPLDKKEQAREVVANKRNKKENPNDDYT